MLKRQTLLLLVSAIVLGGGVLLLESNRQGDRPNSTTDAPETAADISGEAESQGELLFPFAESEVEEFTIERSAATDGDASESLAFRQAETGTWQMTAPDAAEAEGGAIAFLLSQLVSPAARTLTVPASNLADFGLAEPEIAVELTASSTPYRLLVGGSDFTGSQRYVRAIAAISDRPAESDRSDDSEAEMVEIHVVSDSLLNAVNRPVEEWLVQEESDPASDSSSVDGSSEDSDSEDIGSEDSEPAPTQQPGPDDSDEAQAQ